MPAGYALSCAGIASLVQPNFAWSFSLGGGESGTTVERPIKKGFLWVVGGGGAGVGCGLLYNVKIPSYKVRWRDFFLLKRPHTPSLAIQFS